MKTKYKPGTFILVHSIYRLQELDAIGQSVFMWLCGHADQRGTCFPSIKRLAKLCKKSRNTIKDRLRKLEALGLIKRFPRKNDDGENKSNLYQLIEDNWMPKERSGSKNDLPSSINNLHIGQSLATNQNQEEHRYNNSSFSKNSSLSYLHNIPEEDISSFINKFSVSRQFIYQKAQDVLKYCSAQNKIYKNYKFALQGFIEKDLARNGAPPLEKRVGAMKQVGDILSARKIRGP